LAPKSRSSARRPAIASTGAYGRVRNEACGVTGETDTTEAIVKLLG
jgi:hypothetical protein